MTTDTTPTSSRSLRQEEIDGFWRNEFVQQVLDYIKPGNKTARFIIFHHYYKLVEIKQIGSNGGEWEFSCGKNNSFYTYKLSIIVDLLEQIYDKVTTVLSLDGEILIDRTHFDANPDASPDNVIEPEPCI